MPPISRRFLGTAAVMAVLGIAIGFALLVRRELWGVWPHPMLVSAHVHLLLVGAVTQVIAGTAWWMFPRPLRSEPPLSQGAVHLAWWCLTGGTLLRALAEAAAGLGAPPWPIATVAGAGAQVVGMAALVVGLRRRVRAVTPR